MDARFTISETIKYACEGVTDEERKAAIIMADNSPELLNMLQTVIQQGLETDSQDRLVIRLEEEIVAKVLDVIKKANG